jgi:hypothetical protein
MASTRRPAPSSSLKYVCDGQNSVGTVIQVNGGFIAVDLDGAEVGRFKSLREAMRALPPIGRRA